MIKKKLVPSYSRQRRIVIKMQIAVLTLGKEWWFCSCPYIGVGDVVKLERPAKTMHAWPKQPKREEKSAHNMRLHI